MYWLSGNFAFLHACAQANAKYNRRSKTSYHRGRARVASFSGPSQLSVACSRVKLGGGLRTRIVNSKFKPSHSHCRQIADSNNIVHKCIATKLDRTADNHVHGFTGQLTVKSHIHGLRVAMNNCVADCAPCGDLAGSGCQG